MSTKRSRAVVAGLGAAVGAVAAAAVMSWATAPTARADAYSDIVSAVEGDYTAAQADFSAALTDFSSGDVSGGLTNYFDAVDDQFVSAPTNLSVGLVEALNNEPIGSSSPVSLLTTADFGDAVTNAETVINGGESALTLGATDLSAGDYGDAVFYDTFGSFAIFEAPFQYLFIGGVSSLF